MGIIFSTAVSSILHFHYARFRSTTDVSVPVSKHIGLMCLSRNLCRTRLFVHEQTFLLVRHRNLGNAHNIYSYMYIHTHIWDHRDIECVL